MKVARTTTLALGSSLIGSSPSIFLAKPEAWLWGLIVGLVGLVLVLHGTGFLQKCVIRPVLRYSRNKQPVVAIVSDLPWPHDSTGNKTHIWAWGRMTPEEWCSRIVDEAKERNIKVKVEHVAIKKACVRSVLDRYSVVLNPYGSLYPETNIKELPVLSTILDYVLNGGIFVNVADIPFYWAYDPQRKVLYDLVRHTHQYEQGRIMSFGPFTETPFGSEARVSVVNTEIPGQNGELNPRYYSLKLRNQSLKVKELSSVAVNRAAVIERKPEYKSANSLETGRLESVVVEIDINGQLLTPIFYVNFGKGKFLVSLVFLDYDKQAELAREQITRLQCELILKEIGKSTSKS